MAEITLAEFQRQGAAAGFRFVCPMCGNVATPKDFENAGADPQRAAQECIGRTMNPKPKPQKGKTPCDWAAFGLFKTAGKGLTILMEDGKQVDAFAFEAQPS